jgi:hypothetical protein
MVPFKRHNDTIIHCTFLGILLHKQFKTAAKISWRRVGRGVARPAHHRASAQQHWSFCICSAAFSLPVSSPRVCHMGQCARMVSCSRARAPQVLIQIITFLLPHHRDNLGIYQSSGGALYRLRQLLPGSKIAQVDTVSSSVNVLL